MLEAVLLILGVVALMRFPHLARIDPADYPDVDPGTFAAWYSQEKMAAIWFTSATIGVFVLELIAGFVTTIVIGTSGGQRKMDDAGALLNLAGVALFLVMFAIAVVYGARARRLRTAARIAWPKK